MMSGHTANPAAAPIVAVTQMHAAVARPCTS